MNLDHYEDCPSCGGGEDRYSCTKCSCSGRVLVRPMDLGWGVEVQPHTSTVGLYAYVCGDSVYLSPEDARATAAALLKAANLAEGKAEG